MHEALYYLAPTVCYAIGWWVAGAAAGALPGRASGAASRFSEDVPAQYASGASSEAAPAGLARTLLIGALVLHAGTLLLPWAAGSFQFGFAKLLSATALIALLIWWVESTALPLASLERVLLPMTVIALWLPYVFPGAAFRWDDSRPLFIPHLVVGTLAYAVMFLAALHALLMAVLERRLKPQRAAPGWLEQLLGPGSLPPLMVLERMLFRIIAIGFVLLLATTLTGFVFSEETFGAPLRLEHKTVFSLIAMFIFGFLLTGRWLRGWRGRKARLLAHWGFALLLLSYVGSRFVLEVVLRRFGS